MTINREAIERHINGILASSPQPTDEAFVRDAIDLFCKTFDERGWPDKMPDFTILPPHIKSNDPLGQDGYAGYLVNGESALWRRPYGSNGWAP